MFFQSFSHVKWGSWGCHRHRFHEGQWVAGVIVIMVIMNNPNHQVVTLLQEELWTFTLKLPTRSDFRLIPQASLKDSYFSLQEPVRNVLFTHRHPPHLQLSLRWHLAACHFVKVRGLQQYWHLPEVAEYSWVVLNFTVWQQRLWFDKMVKCTLTYDTNIT